jgi:hypothetical protein
LLVQIGRYNKFMFFVLGPSHENYSL